MCLLPSPPFRGEREGTRRVSDGEGEVGRAEAWSYRGVPHLTPTLSAARGGEGAEIGGENFGTRAGPGFGGVERERVVEAEIGGEGADQ
jgi:hypothetical protein